jgi:hypothetical protein
MKMKMKIYDFAERRLSETKIVGSKIIKNLKSSPSINKR